MAALALLSSIARAQSSGGGVTLSKYTLEITPVVGFALPYDIWGIEGTLNTYGGQAAYSVNDDGALTAGGLFHQKSNDWAYTVDVGYRHEINSLLFHAYFDIGVHYSKFNLKIDYNSSGACVPANCRTDSGSYGGIYGGSGLVIPISSLTLVRGGFRFYNNPQAWVLITGGLSIRFL